MDSVNETESETPQSPSNTVTVTDGKKTLKMPLDQEGTLSISQLEREFPGVRSVAYMSKKHQWEE